jgi:hypothetical protein
LARGTEAFAMRPKTAPKTNPQNNNPVRAVFVDPPILTNTNKTHHKGAPNKK